MDSTFEPTVMGNGWGEMDMSTSETQKRSSNAYERIPVPIVLDELINIQSTDDKFHIGSYGFATVYTCGRVVSFNQNMDFASGASLMLTDPSAENETSAQLCVSVFEMKGNPEFNVGDIVIAIGKIRVFDGEVKLHAFGVNPITDSKQVDGFSLESVLAKKYFSMNGPEMITSGHVAEFENTIFNNSVVVRNAPQGGGDPNVSTQVNGSMPKTNPSQKFGTKTSEQSSSGNARGLTGIKEKIFLAIRDNNASDGIHKEAIRRIVGNAPSFDADLLYLANEGIIYNTQDDQTFSAI